MLRWKGFYMQLDQAHPMNFAEFNVELRPSGAILGKGTDEVGAFRIEGCFHPELALCRFTKQYLGQHPVYYEGVYREENKSIDGYYGFNPADHDGTFQLSHE